MGEFFSIAAAVVWAFAVVFLTRSGKTVSPFALNVFRVAVSTPLLLATMLVAGQPVVLGAPVADYLILFASGVIAIAVSDTLFHVSLNMSGAGISAIAGCSYSPFVVLMAFFMIHERLTHWQFIGMAMVLAGVLAAAGHKPPEGASARRIVLGVVFGVLAMATVAFGIVIAKPVLNRSPVLWATTMRQVGSLLVMLPVAALLPQRRSTFAVFRSPAMWRFSLPATVLGSYLALILWIAGMKYTLAGIAAILNQTSTILILTFASVFLREPLTRRKIAAGMLAVAGIVLVTYRP